MEYPGRIHEVTPVREDADLFRCPADDLVPCVTKGPDERLIHVDIPAVFQDIDGHERRTCLEGGGEFLL